MKAYILFVASFSAILAVEAQPVINSFTPTSGPAGTVVIINGNNFNSTLANNIVYFGGVEANVTAASSNSLTVKVPVGSTLKPIYVLNTTTHLSGFSSKPFNTTFNSGAGQSISASSFNKAVNFTSTSGSLPWTPRAVEAGDIDGDGKPDIIMIARSEVNGSSVNTLSVFRNTSVTGSINTSSFAPPIDFKIGATNYGSTSLAIADIDNDGKLDIAVANLYANYVTIFRNTATAGSITTSSLATGMDISTSDGSYSISIRDMDQDGKADVIASNSNQGDANSVSVIRNISSPGNILFETPRKFTTGRGNQFVAIGDIDGDGKPDIATANSKDHSISLLRNTSVPGSITAASFAGKVDFATSPSGPWSVSITDLDKDGKADIVVADGGGIFKNTATAGNISTSSLAAEISIGLGGTYITTGDINGDNKLDLVATGNGNSAIVQNITDSGTLSASSFASPVSLRIGSSPSESVIADFDGDSKPDIAAANAGYNGLNQSLGILQNVIGSVVAPVPIGKVQITAPALRLHIKDTALVSAKLYNADGTLATKQPVFTWQSDNSRVAFANQGQIIGKTVGTTFINVTDPQADTSLVSVDVLVDSAEIPSSAVNITFTPLTISIKANHAREIPQYVVTDYKGKELAPPIVFKADSSSAIAINGNTILAANKPGAYELYAYVNDTKLNGSLPVLIYADNSTNQTSDTIYKVQVAYAPADFRRMNIEAQPIKLEVYQYIMPFTTDTTSTPVVNHYYTQPEMVTSANNEIISVSGNGNLIAHKPGSTYVTAQYRGINNRFICKAIFDFAGSWKATGKKRDEYALCYQFSNPIGYYNTQFGSSYYFYFDQYPGDYKHKDASGKRDSSLSVNYLYHPDNVNSNGQLIPLSSIVTAWSNLYTYWNNDNDQFLAIVDDYRNNKMDTAIFKRSTNCHISDSLEEVLVGDSVRSWVYDSDSTFDYTPNQIYGYFTFYKNSHTFIDFDTSHTGNFVPVHYGSWKSENNNKLIIYFYDTLYVNNSVEVLKCTVHYFISQYSDSLITLDSDTDTCLYLDGIAHSSGYSNDPVKIYLYNPNKNVLPITLIYFDATLSSKNVLVSWQTTNELNVSHFNIQRSTDGVHFTNVGTAQAKGNSSVNTSYSFTDATALQQNSDKLFYRLQSVDMDGTSTFSAVRFVALGSPNNFTVFPNPASAIVFVQGQNLSEINLTDVSGRKLLSKFANGVNNMSINIAALPKGLYFIQMKNTKGNTQTQKLVVQ